MAYPGDKTNYPRALNLINRPTQRQWPVPAPFQAPLIQNLPSIIANGMDRTFLPQVGVNHEGPVRKALREIMRARSFNALTVKNFPKTLEGPQSWYPGALVQSVPSVVAGIASASGPTRTMRGQDYTPGGWPYTDHRNYRLNPECVVEI